MNIDITYTLNYKIYRTQVPVKSKKSQILL